MSKFPRYKVISEDGLGPGSKIIDLETGLPIANIAHVTLHASPDEIWRADVQLLGVAVDVNLIELRPRRFLWRRVRAWFCRFRAHRIARRAIAEYRRNFGTAGDSGGSGVPRPPGDE